MRTLSLRTALRLVRLASVVAVAATVVATPVVAQPTAPQGDASVGAEWLPWLGCWRLIDDRTNDVVEAVEGERLVCMSPTAVPHGVRVTTLVDGEQTFEETLFADGSRQPVQHNGCQGTQSAQWSADGNRLFTAMDLSCEGGHGREASGVGMMGDRGVWIDVQIVRVGDQRELSVRRYRRASADSTVAAGVAGLAENLALSAATARVATAEPLDLDDIVEASTHVDAEVIEAMLLESDASFALDADTLIALADAGVSGTVIDLMVALSYPEYFAVDTEPERGYVGHGYGYGYGYYYPSSAFGYWSPAFAPFGYGYSYYPRRPIVTVRNRGSFGGRVIAGRGYARVRVRDDAPRGGLNRLFSGGSSKGRGGSIGSGGGGGSVTKSGATRGSSGSTRKAKPRGSS